MEVKLYMEQHLFKIVEIDENVQPLFYVITNINRSGHIIGLKFKRKVLRPITDYKTLDDTRTIEYHFEGVE